jgi:hypothetical protein
LLLIFFIELFLIVILIVVVDRFGKCSLFILN